MTSVSITGQPGHLNDSEGEPAEALDITAVMVFGVTAIGLGGYSLLSLLGIVGLG